MTSAAKQMQDSGVVLTKEMRAAFKAVRNAAKRLQSRAFSPLPVLAGAPLGRSCTERIEFVEACIRWHQGVSEAFGFRESIEEPFLQTSVLGAVFNEASPSAIDEGAAENAIAPVDVLGEPPESILRPEQAFGEPSQGLPMVSRTDLRSALETVSSMMLDLNRIDPLEDDQLRSIALRADQGALVYRELWEKLHAYLKHRLSRTKRIAIELVEWTDLRLKGVGSAAKRTNNSWLAKALRLMRQAEGDGKSLKLAELAKAVAKDESTVYRKFPEYFVRGHHPSGAGATPIFDDTGTVADLTKDKLPAKPS